MEERNLRGNADRQHAGGMWVVGNTRGSASYVTLAEKKGEIEASKITGFKKVQASAVAAITRNGSVNMLREMRQVDRGAGVYPTNVMGGKGGITAACEVSYNLGQEAHFDADDMGKSISIWVERKVGRAGNWFLCFPNMMVHYKGKVFNGLRIQLFHGAVVEWDGRRMKHFTTVIDVGNDNVVNGLLFAPCRRTIPKVHQEPFSSNPGNETLANKKLKRKVDDATADAVQLDNDDSSHSQSVDIRAMMEDPTSDVTRQNKRRSLSELEAATAMAEMLAHFAVSEVDRAYDV
mmetsp:Transcript_913/g.1806  ORF Transcript_913/g.1806 Transcript_913/m.1806 type:complete len:291 (+) Transcript_913:2369-3241(+)